MNAHNRSGGKPRGEVRECERLCAATGEVKPVADMIRFVVGPNRAVVPDLRRCLPGRGIWITANRQTLELAIRRNSFQRSFKCEIAVSSDVVHLTEQLLQKAALDALAMARKAGKVAMGFAQSEAALARGRVLALIHAVEAAPDGIRKLNAARSRCEEAAAIAVLHEFSAAQLDLAFGRPNVVHAALLASRVGESFLARVARLHGFQTVPARFASASGDGVAAQSTAGCG
jgi:predicted RNA-binding protein YlxR (DUF448 family)